MIVGGLKKEKMTNKMREYKIKEKREKTVE